MTCVKILGFFIFCFCGTTVFVSVESDAAKVAMKVVESPMSYGFNNDLISPNLNHGNLILQVQPREFTGPEHFRNWLGKCYNLTDDQYLYTLCPFHNATQFEQSTRWNAYQGVLGVWQEWNIHNNTFSSMMMLNGDNCATVQRSVEVTFECNETEETLKEVSELKKCQYHFVLQTPLVCHPDSQLVYPRLPLNLRQKWDELETDLLNKDVTEKGYHEGLQRIFVQAGFRLPPKISDKKRDSWLNSTLLQNIPQDSATNNLGECLKEVDELRKEIEALKLLLELTDFPKHGAE